MNSQYQQQLSDLFAAAPKATPGSADGDFVIYGAGGFGRMAGKLIEQAGGNILYFLDRECKDNFPWPVRTLAEIGKPDPAVRLVIGIFNAFVDLGPLLAALGQAGFERIVTSVELFSLLQECAPASQYWLATPATYRQHREEIIECVDGFADEASKRLFVALWRYRLLGNLADLPTPTPVELQYFPQDVPAWELPLRMIDCGAYTGDTLQFIRRHKIPTQAIVAFEPDPGNYKKLVACFGTWPEVEQHTLIPCGVYSSTVQMKFSASGGAGSAITEDGDVTIQCISIDECLPAFKPNLIKMDIEGAEIEALLGAEKTIRANRPGLAISAYHTPHHIWQIPKLLKAWDLGYSFYLRTHLHQEFDTVLYAVPDHD